MSEKYAISLDQLKQEYIWALWGWRHQDNDPSKDLTKKPLQVPAYPGQPEYGARVDHPNDWKSYKVAAAKYAENAAKNLKNPLDRYEGVGLYFANLGSYSLCGLDIDAHKEETLHAGNPHTAALLQHFAGTYMEYSPSGNGIHIIMLMLTDKIPAKAEYGSTYYQKNTKEDLEFYPSGITNRFFTFTGNQIGECSVVADMTDEALSFLDKYMRKPLQEKATAQVQHTHTSRELDEAEIERRIKRACVLRGGFADLFKKGSISKYHNDDSAADLALCGHLSYYFDCNAQIMDDVFRRSALYRPKWDEKRGAQTYGEMTIEKAISTHTGGVYGDLLERVPLDGKKLRLTIERLADELTENWGIIVRENEITRNMDFVSSRPERIKRDDLVTELYSALGELYTGCNFQIIDAYIGLIGRKNSYNPVLEYLHTLVWDGKDYLSRLYDLMYIEKSDWLSRVLIRKWLLQCYAVLGNTEEAPFAADGVLTLAGKQGSGKSALFSHLALRTEWFGDGRTLDKFNKDTEQWILENWISELGEVESSFTKASAEDMKQFISRKIDTYRPAYAKSAIVAPRQTSLCATCNNERYLVDKTGNRRWYTVAIKKKIPYKDIAAFPFTQLWAQIAQMFNSTPDDDGYLWHLTPEEESALEQRNAECEQTIKGEAEVASILDYAARYPDDHKIVHVTATDWKNAWSPTRYKESLQRYTAEQLGKALNASGYEATRGRINGVRARYYELPVPLTYED